MPRVTSAISGMVAARECAPGRMTMAPEHLQALRQVAQAYDDALQRFAARTLGEARTRVVMRIAQQRSAPAPGVAVVD
jgi:hypothetical protein